jgi:hypothetical protein
MAIFTMIRNAVRELNSCWMGVIMNGIVVLTVLLSIVFPPNSSYLVPTGWSAIAVFLIGGLSVAGIGLAVRDFFQGERFVACLGFGLCCWPTACIVAFFII